MLDYWAEGLCADPLEWNSIQDSKKKPTPHTDCNWYLYTSVSIQIISYGRDTPVVAPLIFSSISQHGYCAFLDILLSLLPFLFLHLKGFYRAILYTSVNVAFLVWMQFLAGRVDVNGCGYLEGAVNQSEINVGLGKLCFMEWWAQLSEEVCVAVWVSVSWTICIGSGLADGIMEL